MHSKFKLKTPAFFNLISVFPVGNFIVITLGSHVKKNASLKPYLHYNGSQCKYWKPLINNFEQCPM